MTMGKKPKTVIRNAWAGMPEETILTLDLIADKFSLDGKELRESRPKMPFVLDGFTREGMALMFADLGYKRGAEVGVRMGEFSEILCKSNPGLEQFYLVDPWLSYSGYHTFFSQQDMDGHCQMARARLSEFSCCEFVRKTSMKAVREVSDHFLDFVYIDGNHNFQSVTNDIAEWGRKVRFGGIICGDDFRRFRDQHDSHVVFVLEGYVKAYRVHPWFVFGHQTHNSTWMWVKGCEHNLLDRA